MIFLDAPKHRGWKYGASSHLVCDGDISELIEFGKKLGLGESSIHWTPYIPHFDLTESKYRKALLLGAVQISSRDIVRIKVSNKEKGLYENRRK